ncbi:DNA-binding MarR family transcriptional regulator [Prauserella shujinwangii]|uniref:DNA-binding MarR family transcriptional regulator n=1 Tax=Prauserella shujinwangii TaxID=1453103 RepID=A0A2T0LPZ1_9PSEU|nr:MarR family winged helix-turn-helix transcriptional regulator [Prauserella shujinwangii]PRX45394.1 DNA-binding MarR family transcriptional regulator [Prauserella shujinwangii]
MTDVAEQSLVAEWHALLARHAAVSGALECRLQDEHGIGVNEFETLERLATCDRKCRAADLTDATHLTQSTTSRLISRMERDGLVERSMCDIDRRGIFVMLTAAGRRLYEEAKPTHRAVLREQLAGEG